MTTPKKVKEDSAPITPRRSTRLQAKMTEKTPEPPTTSTYKPRGPRALMKSYKIKSTLNINEGEGTHQISIPDICITSATANESQIEKELSQIVEHKEMEMKIKMEPSEKPEENPIVTPEIVEEIKKEAKNLNETSLMADESIISVPESPKVDITAPPKEATCSPREEKKDVKDSTFSPIVDRSIHDSRPHIDVDESIASVTESSKLGISVAPKDATFSPREEKNDKVDSTFSPVVDRSIHDSRPHIDIDSSLLNKIEQRNSSTPLQERIIKRNTPKAGPSSMAALTKILSPKVNVNQNLSSLLNETLKGQYTLVNPLEKSILKSSRKRSLSVTDGDSLIQKKVVFVSPKIMEIGKIDEQMMQSFRDEKENSISKTQGNRRKRSMSASDENPARLIKVNTPHKRIDMPNFKAIHEARFKKMESIEEHTQRKAVRAKRLITPSKSVPAYVPKEFAKAAEASKIPRKMHDEKTALQNENPQRLKRSMSSEPSTSQVKKITIVNALPRSMSQDKVKFTFPSFNPSSITNKPTTMASTSSASQNGRGKLVEERRAKNMSMFKSNTVMQRGNATNIRKKNENMLKGVRLNKRFELQMQHRMANNNGN